MYDCELLYSRLAAHVHRWRAINVRAVSNKQMYAFLLAVSDSTLTAAPRLISLAFPANQAMNEAFWSLTVARSPSLFGDSAPSLESISLECIYRLKSELDILCISSFNA